MDGLESVISDYSIIVDEVKLDATMPWTVDLENSELPAAPDEAKVEEGQEENDDTLAEEALMTQVMERLNAEGENEAHHSTIEDFFSDSESPSKPCYSIQSRWVTLDIDLPLKLRVSTETQQSGSNHSNVTGAFADASFHPVRFFNGSIVI
ncbi:hypothetical protein KIN20_012124 [Parelaphostrongylus tenuis]|uniref:Uncharacterized protein n=1 Tax=Parelaphostrongylus tenuis TaxID=148309 RepID=A0AAD5QMN9_PARTN|nr:hypothetical protein KIN20_012124 [Parelaphostrongylus tenuis]